MRGAPGLPCSVESSWLPLHYPVLSFIFPYPISYISLTLVTVAVTKCPPEQLSRGRTHSWPAAWEEERLYAARAWGGWGHYIKKQRKLQWEQSYTLTYKAYRLPLTHFLKVPQSPNEMAPAGDQVLKHMSQSVAISFNLGWGEETKQGDWFLKHLLNVKRRPIKSHQGSPCNSHPHLSAKQLLGLVLAIMAMASKGK